MEHERCEKQAPIPFRCSKVVPGVAKPDDSHTAAIQIMETDGKQDAGNSLSSPTPEKPECRSRAKGLTSPARKGKPLPENIPSEGAIIQPETVSFERTSNDESLVSEFSELSPPVLISSREDDSIELPEKYKTLSVLFDRMESSIRLLALCKRLPTFQNISTQVEILSKRKFLCSHLAQMKFAFPEAIHIEKILIHDEKSLCMNPDMKITLVQDVVGRPLYPDQSASMALCQAFHARLLDFLSTHPEGTDIPEALLPEPFNRRNHIVLNTLPKGSSKELAQPNFADLESLSSASHLSSSFHKQFSQKIILPETRRIQLFASPAQLLSISTDDEDMEVSKSPQRKDNLCSVSAVKSPAGVIYTPSRTVPQLPEITPAKYSSNTDELMTDTPALQTPKRAMPTPHEKLASEDDELVAEPKSAHSVRRSLIYSPSKTDGSVSDPVACTSAENRANLYACKETTATKRNILGEEITGSPTTQLQVVCDIAAGAAMDHKIGQTGQSCLLGMFDTICFISGSTNCSLITKQELVHKIISNNLEIEETREVEEQLGLLEELLPDWISRKSTSSGDFLYCIKHASDPESIRARLVEVV